MPDAGATSEPACFNAIRCLFRGARLEVSLLVSAFDFTFDFEFDFDFNVLAFAFAVAVDVDALESCVDSVGFVGFCLRRLRPDVIDDW